MTNCETTNKYTNDFENNKYRVIRKIGSGSFGEIFLGIGYNNVEVTDIKI